MVRHVILFLGLVLTIANIAPVAAYADVAACTRNQILSGTCPTVTGEIVDDGVQLGAESGTPGSSDGNGGGDGNPGANGSPGDVGVNAPPAGPVDRVIRDGFTVTGPVTLSDLVNFRPAPGVDHMQPNGWMIVGLDTNFYATSGVQVQNGLLLGEPASVRFTPVRYRWSYGDGTIASRSTPGTTWQAQGVREFDPTPTSHVYTASGTYLIDLIIDFAAEYRWSSGDWTTIAGTIAVPANRLVATAGGAKTVLVERECTLNPAGPGC